MLKRITSLLSILSLALTAWAGIPNGYYTKADGKKYTELKAALNSCISNHKVFSYSRLWDYYPYTYYVIGNPEQVLDLYSDDVTYFSNTTGLNKEHTVPKSWWGGSTSMGPGCDIFNVIPSEQKANSAKSNYPLGVIRGNATFDNGVTRIGSSGVSGYNGGVFEPKDDYKGDFARIYFYVATCYPDLEWDKNSAKAMTNSSELTLQSWIINMLLEWNINDPVDAGEIQRNEDVYKQQGNRNPFIDYPSLADYIWGAKSNETYYFAEHPANEGNTDTYPAKVPEFSVDYGTADAPKNVSSGTVITIKGGTDNAVLYTRMNGEEWTVSNPKKGYNSTTQTEYTNPASIKYTLTADAYIEAYCTQEGYTQSETVNAYFRVVNFDTDYLLHEEFDAVTGGNNTATQGSSTVWGGNDNFPKDNLKAVYQAGNAVKLGTSTAVGSMTSRTMNTEGGTLQVEFDVKGWSSVEGTIVVTLTGAPSQSAKYTAVMSSTSFEHVKLEFENVSANPTLTLATSAKRAFIDNISVTQQKAVEPLYGDANGDGRLSVLDIVMMVNYILNGYDDAALKVCDLNDDGKISVADVSSLAVMMSQE